MTLSGRAGTLCQRDGFDEATDDATTGHDLVVELRVVSRGVAVQMTHRPALDEAALVALHDALVMLPPPPLLTNEGIAFQMIFKLRGGSGTPLQILA